MNDNTLQYIDYAVYERLMDMTSSRQFWHSELEGCNLQRQLSLPVDRHRPSHAQRSGLASIAQISFDNDISTAFLNYALSHRLTSFQLGLAIFYAFLFKLTHGERDLCITSINANRYRTELHDMIGMFVATLPYRMELNPRWSFDELVSHVRDKSLSILEHSHYSLQHILADVQLNQSNVPFLETMFDFITITSAVNCFILNDMNLEQISTRKLYQITKFDFSLAFVYNGTLDDDRISCRLVCSCDLFDETTVTTIVQRLQYLCAELFFMNPSTNQLDRCQILISQLNLISPEEAKEAKEMVFHRQTSLVNEGRCYVHLSIDRFM
jgi:non-ribosomal peptide synthetase component F